MIDLTNKTDDEINALIQKYELALSVFSEKERIPALALIIEIGINHINDKYNLIVPYWKTWIIVVLEKLYDKIENESDIKKIIDDFLQYHNSNYEIYISDIVMSTSEYDKDNPFINTYVENYLKL